MASWCSGGDGLAATYSRPTENEPETEVGDVTEGLGRVRSWGSTADSSETHLPTSSEWMSMREHYEGKILSLTRRTTAAFESTLRTT